MSINSSTRRAAFAGSAVLAGAALLLLQPEPAAAHATILDSTPAQNAQMAPGALDVRLRFNSRIDAARSRLSISQRGTAPDTVAIAPAQSPDLLAGQTAPLAPGDYRLHWQVLATDGHITRGDIPFTVRAP